MIAFKIDFLSQKFIDVYFLCLMDMLYSFNCLENQKNYLHYIFMKNKFLYQQWWKISKDIGTDAISNSWELQKS